MRVPFRQIELAFDKDALDFLCSQETSLMYLLMYEVDLGEAAHPNNYARFRFDLEIA